MFDIQRRYLSAARSRGFKIPAGYDDLRPQCEAAEKALAAKPAQTLPCHNDLLAANFVDDGDRIWLIDYELSGNNDPCFELGNIAAESHLDDDALAALVTAYYQRPSRSKIARAWLLKEAWSACPAGPCGAQSSTPRARSSTTSGDGRWNGSRAPRPASPPANTPPCSRTSSAMTEPTSPALPARARVVIIGGGVIGASVAYHLAQLGWTDVLLLEQGQLSCGTTWHAAGLVGQLRASESGTRLVQYSTELYERLERETGLSTGFRRCGGVTVARTQDRLTQLKRTAATAEAYQLDCELISPEARPRALPGDAGRTTWWARSGCQATAAPTRPT